MKITRTRLDIGLTGPLTTGVARDLDVTGTIPTVAPGEQPSTGAPVPDGATAIVANVTAVAPTDIGFVSARPGGASGTPTTSSINISTPGGVWPNAVTVQLGDNGKINLYYFGPTPGSTTHLLIDIVAPTRRSPSAPTATPSSRTAISRTTA